MPDLDSSFSVPIAVTPERLTRLGKIVQQGLRSDGAVLASPVLTIRAKCRDGIVRDFASVDEVLRYPNHQPSRICELKLECRSGNEDYVQLMINGDQLFARTVTVMARGREESLLDLRRRARDEMSSWKPWWGIMHLFRTPLGQVLTFVLPALLATALWRATDAHVHWGKSVALFMLFLTASCGLAAAVIAAYAYLCPAVTFDIGESKSSNDVRDKLRWLVLPLILGLASKIATLMFAG